MDTGQIVGRCVLALALCFSSLTKAEEKKDVAPVFRASSAQISAALSQQITGITWRPNCPVPIEDLRHLSLTVWRTSGKSYQGELIVHKHVVGDMIATFHKLFEARFPVPKMVLIHNYGGSDDASVADNNTSAFNCRNVTGGKGWSKHAYGLAIDINPFWNPYIKGNQLIPPAATEYVERKSLRRGMIEAGDIVHRAFISRGWTWGGSWRSVKDYQHFQFSPDKLPGAKKKRRKRRKSTVKK
jgi:hypothetical protein